MKKKFLSISLAIAIVLSMSTSAFAVDVPDAPDEPIKNNIVCLSRSFDQELIDVLENTEFAYATQEDGTTIPISSTVTIKEILPTQNLNRNAPIGSTTYSIDVAATREQKTEPGSGSKNLENVRASAYITMIWTDVQGTKNTMDQLFGGVDFIKGTYIESKISWGNTASCVSGNRRTSETSFDIVPNYTNQQLYARVQVSAEEISNFFLTVTVHPSIFD